MFYLTKHIEDMRLELDSLETLMRLNKTSPETYKEIQEEYDLILRIITLYDEWRASKTFND